RNLCEWIERAEPAEACARLLDERTAMLVRILKERDFLTRSPSQLLDVERRAAGFASWYELFPRSATDDVTRHGTFDDVIARLPAIQAMGFDVLYFPPIHPIGRSHRKGRNQPLTSLPGEPGSPYAIGASEGEIGRASWRERG